MRTATTKRKSPASTSKTPAGACKTLKCAFCAGTGRDPYKVLSRVANCPVCTGHKTVEVETPFVACLYCKGTGRQRHTRLTCSACRGTGVIALAGPTDPCSQCGGTGREPAADLSCSLCKGTGLVAKGTTHEKEQLAARTQQR
jgi:DnaJ-class molecular chaperone